mmetsp:Transcript_29622/g.65621  ORF Transcript_29622/g.65621 Transcript_29622/m.65621 type:complete len:366 (-) Transcript_29622:3-1100(-)
MGSFSTMAESASRADTEASSPATLPGGPSSKRRKTSAGADQQQKSPSTYHAYFEALRRLDRAQAVLEAEKRPHLLLVLANENMNSVVEFLSIEDVGRCEMVSKVAFSSSARTYWNNLDKGVRPEQRSSADDVMSRVVRHHLASKFAKSNADHIVGVNGIGDRSFPDLDVDVFNDPERYELFARFSRRGPPTRARWRREDRYRKILEGFVRWTVLELSGDIVINMSDLNLKKHWSVMDEVTSLTGDDCTGKAKRIISKEMCGLVLVLVSVRKSDLRTNLVAASVDGFTDHESGRFVRTSTEDDSMPSNRYERTMRQMEVTRRAVGNQGSVTLSVCWERSSDGNASHQLTLRVKEIPRMMWTPNSYR